MTASEEHESWLPNLVGGVSIWKLAPDLNEEQFFDGRLLVPDTEGSDSLPVRVTWDLTGLVPLADARRDHPERVQKAIEAFLRCLARTAAVFEKGGSGYDRYKQAFTVPALDADGGAHYFFDPKKEKLCVINWGASPRKIKHAKEYLFGYQDFGLLIAKEESAARAAGASGGAKGAAAATGDVAGAAAAVAAGADEAAPTDGAPKTDEQKAKEEEEKKKEEEEKKKKSLWWVWLLILLGVIGVVALLVLWRECNARPALGGDGGVDASAGEGGVDAGEQPIYGHATDDGGPSASDMGHVDGDVLGADAGAADADTIDGSARDGGDVDGAAMDGDIADASSDIDEEDDDAATRGDGGRRRDAGRSRDAGRGRDAGRRTSGGGGGSGGGGSGGGGSGGGGSGGGGGGGPPTGEDGQPLYGEQRDEDGDVIYWIPGEGGQPISLPHREHYHPDAVQWRIVGGTSRVYDYSGTGPTFHVYLRPGESFDGVRVQWRDGAGGWHDH